MTTISREQLEQDLTACVRMLRNARRDGDLAKEAVLEAQYERLQNSYFTDRPVARKP